MLHTLFKKSCHFRPVSQYFLWQCAILEEIKLGGFCVTNEEYQAAARYWEEKDASSVKLEQDKLRTMRCV